MYLDNISMKLINKIKPEVLDALKESRIRYRASYTVMITDLSKVENYRDLTIKAIDQIILFLPKDLRPDGRTDFYYGDYLLQKEYQL